LFSNLNLDQNLNYDNIISICKFLNIELDKDLLFDEITLFNNLLNEKCIKDSNFNSIEKYCRILSNNDLINLTKVIETVLCIPIGNDFVESVFILMHRIWRNNVYRFI
jgi:hypothetical protein